MNKRIFNSSHISHKFIVINLSESVLINTECKSDSRLSFCLSGRDSLWRHTCHRSLCVAVDKWWSHGNCSLNGGSCWVRYQQAWSKWVTSKEVKCWWFDLFKREGSFGFFFQKKGDKKPGFRMYRSRNESLVLAAQDCCTRIADHDLCIESARQNDCGLLGLLCLRFLDIFVAWSSCDSSFSNWPGVCG